MKTLDSSPRPDSPESSGPQSSAPRIAARWISDTSELETVAPSWRKLVHASLLPNPAYEPEFLVPLFKHRNSADARLLLIETQTFGAGTHELIGLIPIIERKFYRLPYRCFHAWRPDEAFDATPLLHRAHANQAFGQILESLHSEGGRLFSLDTVSANSEFETVLSESILGTQDQANRYALPRFQRATFSRSALRPLDSADEYLRQSTSKNRRKKTKRLLKNLQALGQIRFEHTDESSDIQAWAEDFIDLEASGWKGRNQSAIASSPDSLAFFLEMVERFASNQSIRFGRLTLDSAPIAMLCDLSSGSHVSAFKVAFDERLAEYSPGFLLELENIRWLHKLGCDLCDSCTSPDNELLNRLYNDQLPYQSVVFGLDSGTHRCIRTVMPAIQRTAQLARNFRVALAGRVIGTH